jgi:hypothetical protein
MGFPQPTTGSTTNAIPVLNVQTYGAVGNGIANDAPAIQNAINALPVTGGIVYFPAGTYKVNTMLTIGNGAAGSPSTRQGIQLVGAAPAGLASSQGMGNVNTSRIVAGAAMTAVLFVQGPLVGWGLKNLHFVANSLCANSTIVVRAAQWGEVQDCCFTGNTAGTGVPCIYSDCVIGYNTMHNTWTSCTFEPGALASSMAYQATGNGVNGTSNTCYESFIHCTIAWQSAVAGTLYGIYLSSVDNIKWIDTHFFGVTPAGGTNRAVQLDYSGVTPDWPADCSFIDTDFGGTGVTLGNSGAPNAGVTNVVTGVGGTNGRPVNPNLAGLTWNQASELHYGTGVPPAGLGNNGDYYLRSDGGALTHVYFKAAGAWTGLV